MKNNMIGICPGSFDPITKGHVDIIKRSLSLFKKVIVLAVQNPEKNYSFTVEERLFLIKNALKNLENIEILSYEGLLTDFTKKIGNCCIIKGLRAISDFEYEFQHALTNKVLNNNVETIFMNTSSKYMYLSSSVVKQVAKFNGDISNFVCSDNVEFIKKRFYGV